MTTGRRGFLARVGGAALGVGTVASLGAGAVFDGGGDLDPTALVAGSLLPLASDVPGAAVEAHGSLAARRLVVEGARDPDVLALADPALFAGIADRITLFATNALVVAYRPDSPHADAIADDWGAALAREDVPVGRTDPEQDPLGYRTVLALRLAERFGMADTDILDRSYVLPETSLLRDLEAGELDAAFAYRNMAVAHDLPAVDLPARIDFSDPAHAETYRSVSLDLGDRTVRGAPVRYGAAALTDAGREWLDALVSDRERLRAHGFGVPDSYPVRRAVE